MTLRERRNEGLSARCIFEFELLIFYRDTDALHNLQRLNWRLILQDLVHVLLQNFVFVFYSKLITVFVFDRLLLLVCCSLGTVDSDLFSFEL